MSAEDALAAVESALYAYSTVGPRLDARRAAAAAATFTALRAQRDVLRGWVAGAGATPSPPPPAYDLGPLPDPAAGYQVLLRAEEALAAAHAALVRESSGRQRSTAAGWLASSAVRAVEWRAASGVSPSTVAFPGLSTP